VAAIVLLALYLQLPRLVDAPRLGDALGLGPDRLATLVVHGTTDGDVRLERNDEAWTLPDLGGARADADRVACLVAHLRGAPCRPADTGTFRATPYAVSLTTDRGHRVRLELGEADEPFRRQAVRIGEAVYTIETDLLAALGLLPGEPAPGNATFVQPWTHRLGGAVLRAELETPFATYAVRRDAPDSDVWRARANDRPATADADGLRRWAAAALSLPIERPASETLWRRTRPLYRLRLTDAAGGALTLVATGPVNGAGEHLVRVEERDGPPRYVANRPFDALFVSGRTWLRDLPLWELATDRVAAFAVLRNGRSYRIERTETGWTLARPALPYAIHTPASEGPGAPPPENRADAFLARFARIVSREVFDPAERERLVRTAFAAPAAELRFTLSDGTERTLLLSDEIPGTGARLLRTGTASLVVRARPESYAPDLTWFLDPEAIEGKEIAW